MKWSRQLPLWMLACSMWLGMASVAWAGSMVSVAKREANMREGPGTRYAVVWTLSRGYPLEVVGHRGGWLKVKDFEGDRGWVLRSLTQQRKAHRIVRVDVAHLRSGAGPRARVIGRLKYGDVLERLARRGDWAQVRTVGGKTGWVARRLLWGG